MRNIRSLVLGLVLVILSPLGWGEDIYYCKVERSAELAYKDGELQFKDFYYGPTFGLKLDLDELRISVKFEGFDEPHEGKITKTMSWNNGSKSVEGNANVYNFVLSDDKNFYMTSASGSSGATMRAGTCTKF